MCLWFSFDVLFKHSRTVLSVSGWDRKTNLTLKMVVDYLDFIIGATFLLAFRMNLQKIVSWTYSVVVWESSEEAPLEPPHRPNTGSVRDRPTPLVSASLVHRLDTRTQEQFSGEISCIVWSCSLFKCIKISSPPCTKPIPLFTAGFFSFLSEWKTCMNNKPLECRALPSPWDNSDGVHSSEVFKPVGRYALTPCLRPFLSTLMEQVTLPELGVFSGTCSVMNEAEREWKAQCERRKGRESCEW